MSVIAFVELWYDAFFMGRVCFDILSSQIIMSRIHTKSHWICRHIVKRVSGLAGSGLATVKLFFSVSNNLAS